LVKIKLIKHLSFIILLVFAIFLRSGTFFTSHNSDDQVYYHAAAMKLDREGFKGYNLQNVGLVDKGDVRSLIIESNPKKTILAIQKKKRLILL